MLTLAVSPMRGVLSSLGMVGGTDSMSMQHEMSVTSQKIDMQTSLSDNAAHNCDQCCEGDCCDQTCNTCVFHAPIILGSLAAVFNNYSVEPILFITTQLQEQPFIPLLQPPISKIS